MTDAKGIGEIKIGNKHKWIVTSNQAPLMWFSDAMSDTTIQLALSPQKH
jgi:hypothetical protein